MRTLLISLQRDLDTIGLKYLHYYLLANGEDSRLLYLPKFNHENTRHLEAVKRFILEYDPGLIGFSLMSIEYYSAASLTGYLKKFMRSVPVVWGGIHPTISPESCLDYADYVCRGEGERTILDMARAAAGGRPMKTINNLCYRDNGDLKKNTLYPLIENLDEIPCYQHLPCNSYVLEGNGIILIEEKALKKYSRNQGKTYSIITTRGCPFSCTYCCNNFTSRMYGTRKIRRRSILNIIGELQRAVRENPDLEYINFQDDCFLACSENYLEKFTRLYREQIGCPFIIRAIPNYVNRAKLKALKDSGLTWISLGLQSGSDRISQELYRRRTTRADFLRAAGIIHDLGLAAFYDVIVDNPFENEDEKIETVEAFIETPKPFYPEFFSMVFYAGTELYEKAKLECPDRMEDYRKKDYFIPHKSTINNLVRMAAFLPEKKMRKILKLYRNSPGDLRFRSLGWLAGLSTMLFYEPISYFKVIKLSQGGSILKTLKAIPVHMKEGLMRYLSQFKG